jgi:hypothetical protein
MRMLVATAVMVTAGASQGGDMSDEEVVTYRIDDVLAVLEHVEHMTLEQIEARIAEIETEEMPLPLEIVEFEKLQLAAMYFRKFNL